MLHALDCCVLVPIKYNYRVLFITWDSSQTKPNYDQKSTLLLMLKVMFDKVIMVEISIVSNNII